VVAIVGDGCVRGLPFVRGLRGHGGAGAPLAVQPWAGLVELVEAGRADGADARRLVGAQLAALRSEGPVTLALACAHACALAPVLAQAGDVDVADAAVLTAQRVRLTLRDAGLLARRHRPGRLELQSSHPSRAAGAIRGTRVARSPARPA
jgi:glutamate racemase